MAVIDHGWYFDGVFAEASYTIGTHCVGSVGHPLLLTPELQPTMAYWLWSMADLFTKGRLSFSNLTCKAGLKPGLAVTT